MIFHVVLTQFATDSQEAIDRTFTGALELRDAIPELTEVRCGFLDSSADAGYDAIFEFGFEDRAGLEAFMSHAAHERYVNEVLPSMGSFVAYDYGEFAGVSRSA